MKELICCVSWKHAEIQLSVVLVTAKNLTHGWMMFLTGTDLVKKILQYGIKSLNIMYEITCSDLGVSCMWLIHIYMCVYV